MRLDGAAVGDWPAESRFRHVGYLPQEVELFEGSVAENIARLSEPDNDAVIAAAQQAGCHDMVMRLSENYNTPVAAGGANLSAGQRQRVALARALYGDPALIVLDEPDANLDTDGEVALSNTLRNLAQRGVTTLMVTHNFRLLRMVEHILVLKEGVLLESGPRDEVLKRFMRPAPAAGEKKAQAGPDKLRRKGQGQEPEPGRLKRGRYAATSIISTPDEGIGMGSPLSLSSSR